MNVPLPPVPPIVQIDPSCPSGCTTFGDPPLVRFRNEYELSRSWLHEMGHVFDNEVMEPNGLRPVFARIDGRRWTTPASEERFAIWYRLCALNRRLRRTVTDVFSFRATPAQHVEVCNLIRGAV